MWVNRTARYPWITKDSWCTRTWLLLRVGDPADWSTAQRRVAGILDSTAVQARAPMGLREMLIGAINAYEDAHPAQSPPVAAGE